jgi:hypothetical protein
VAVATNFGSALTLGDDRLTGATFAGALMAFVAVFLAVTIQSPAFYFK